MSIRLSVPYAVKTKKAYRKKHNRPERSTCHE